MPSLGVSSLDSGRLRVAFFWPRLFVAQSPASKQVISQHNRARDSTSNLDRWVGTPIEHDISFICYDASNKQNEAVTPYVRHSLALSLAENRTD
jgi:hypothetical protein